MAAKMVDNTFKLKIGPNLVVLNVCVQVSILNHGAIVVIFVFFVIAAIQNG